MLLQYRIKRLGAVLVDCIARIALSLCILAAACAVFIGALLSLVHKDAGR